MICINRLNIIVIFIASYLFDFTLLASRFSVQFLCKGGGSFIFIFYEGGSFFLQVPSMGGGVTNFSEKLLKVFPAHPWA